MNLTNSAKKFLCFVKFILSIIYSKFQEMQIPKYENSNFRKVLENTIINFNVCTLLLIVKLPISQKKNLKGSFRKEIREKDRNI
jgi:hypothetical protein